MSDSSNKTISSDKNNDFDPLHHIDSLIKGGRIILQPYASINYKKGWVTLIEELINSLRRLPIELYSISAEYAQLEIRFELYEKTQEVKVWRALDAAQRQSRAICMECGGQGKRKIRKESLVVMCRECIKLAELNGETGTWLDKY